MVKFCVLLRTSSGKSQMLLLKIYSRNNDRLFSLYTSLAFINPPGL